MRIILCLLLLSACSVPLAAQFEYAGLGASFGQLSRSGGWSERYGASLEAGVRVEMGVKGGWIFGLGASQLFGNSVREDVLATLRTREGQVLGDLGAGEADFAQLSLKSRGQRGTAYAGYRYSLGEQGWNLRGTFGVSYLVHAIRIQQDAAFTTFSVANDYIKGYDRRAGGWGGSLELGPAYADPSGQFTVFLVGTVNVASTKSLRSTQFDVGRVAPGPSTDTSYGVRVGFVLGLFKGEGFGQDTEDIYY